MNSQESTPQISLPYANGRLKRDALPWTVAAEYGAYSPKQALPMQLLSMPCQIEFR
jgi:hypothetical protein